MNARDRDVAPAEALRAAEGREVELKLAAISGRVGPLKRHPLLRELARGRPRSERLRTLYYDTPDRALAAERLALRVRESGGRYVQALKGEGSDFAGIRVRGEWEAPLPGPEPDLARVPSPEARALAQRLCSGKPLAPVFESDFVRTRHRLRRRDTELFLDLDEGELRACEARAPIAEVELELVRGDAGVLHEIALALNETLPLRPSAWSKAQRGYALAARTRLPAQRAPRIELPETASVEEAFVAVLAASLGQVIANLEPAHDGGDPEGVHQLRVGLRRTRAALALFRDALPGERSRGFEKELRWLAGELGPARDLDVFVTETLGPLEGRLSARPHAKRLHDAARELREEAYARARAALDAPRCAALCLALGGWLTTRGWRGEASDEQRALLAEPARERGRELLERLFEKARRRGRRLAQRSDAERHRLRIALKKLRYGCEFLGSLYGEAQVERSARRLSRLQDVLGSLNDVATTERLLRSIEARVGSEWSAGHERAAGFVEGWTAHESARRLGELERRWSRFRRAKPFWRS